MNNNNDLTRFVESMSFDNRFIKAVDSEELKESLSKVPTKLRESMSTCDCSKGWWVPISVASDYRKNGNGRIYGKKLWKNVVENQSDVYRGCPMLADHPEGDSDGSPEKICGVWLDAKMGEPYGEHGDQLVYGLLVPSGRIGKQDLQDHLQNGLKVGTSTSGFGKLMRDGITVDPDTYQIERLADWVLNPSQSTFFSWDESNNIEDRSIVESNSNTENIIKESIKENIVKDSKLTKLEEKKFRRDMESFLESANNIKDPQERLEEFKEIKSYLEEGLCPDLKESVEAKILEEEASIKKMLEESMTLKEELGIESTKDLKVKLTKIVENTKLAEKEAKDWKSISEQLQEKLNEANKTLDERPTLEFTEFQKNKIDTLTEQITSHDKKASELVKNLAEEYKKIKESYTSLKEQVKSLEDEKVKLIKESSDLQANLNSILAEKAEVSKKLGEATTHINEAKERISRYKTLFEKQRTQFEASINKVNGLKELNEKTSETAQKFAHEAKTAQMKIRKDALKKVKEGKVLRDTETYYEELYRQYGNEMVPYKERIADARSLAEAKYFFLHNVIQNLNESKNIDSMRIPESLAVSPEKRAESIKSGKFEKDSAMDRMPKGWV